MTCQRRNLGCNGKPCMGRIMRNSRLGATVDDSPTDLNTYYDTASATVQNIWNDAIGVWHGVGSEFDQMGSNLAQGFNYALQNPGSAASALLPGLNETAGISEGAQTVLGQPLRNAVSSGLESILIWGGIIVLGLIIVDKEL